MFLAAHSMATFPYDPNHSYGVSILFDVANDKTFEARRFNDLDLITKFVDFRVLCQNISAAFVLINLFFFRNYWNFLERNYGSKYGFFGHFLAIFGLFAVGILVTYVTLFVADPYWRGAAKDLEQLVPRFGRYGSGESSIWFIYALGCQAAVMLSGLMIALAVGVFRFVSGELDVQQE